MINEVNLCFEKTLLSAQDAIGVGTSLVAEFCFRTGGEDEVIEVGGRSDVFTLPLDGIGNELRGKSAVSAFQARGGI